MVAEESAEERLIKEAPGSELVAVMFVAGGSVCCCTRLWSGLAGLLLFNDPEREKDANVVVGIEWSRGRVMSSSLSSSILSIAANPGDRGGGATIA